MSEDRTFTVTGMTCGHCKSAVTTEVLQVPGVRAVDVDLDSGTLTVRGEAEDDAIRKAVDEAGYAVADEARRPRRGVRRAARRRSSPSPRSRAGRSIPKAVTAGRRARGAARGRRAARRRRPTTRRPATPTARGHGRPHAGDGARQRGAGGMPAGVASSQDGYRLVAGAHALRRRPPGAADLPHRRRARRHRPRLRGRAGPADARHRRAPRPAPLPAPAPGAGRRRRLDDELTLPEAGVYRAFADFKVAGAQHTLGVDLFVPGAFAPQDLPAPSTTRARRRLRGRLHEHAGKARLLRAPRRQARHRPAALPRRARPSRRAARGRPRLRARPPRPGPPPEIAFHLGASEPGTYRLFLQFRHEGRVHTAAFTRIVEP